MSGSGVTNVESNWNSGLSGRQLYPLLTTGSDPRNALQLANTLKLNKSGNFAISNLKGEKEVTDVIYICRLAATDFNFTNNFSIITGSGRHMYQDDTGVMDGFNTAFTSSAFTSSTVNNSSLIYSGGPGVDSDGTFSTLTYAKKLNKKRIIIS